MNFANTLKNLRETNDITQGQLAAHLKVSRPTVAGYETKDRQPDFEKLEKIARYFGVSLDYLITGCEDAVMVQTNTRVSEKILDRDVLFAYKNLSYESKQDVLSYIRLLELRDASKPSSEEE